MGKAVSRVALLMLAVALLLAVGCKEDGVRRASSPVTAVDSLRSKDWRPVLIGSRYGYANDDNRLVLPPLYDEARYFSEGLAYVRIGDETGYIDASGKRVIERGGGDFSSGLAVVMKRAEEQAGKAGEHWTYIDKHGEFALRTDYYRANTFSEGLASVVPEENGEAVFIDPEGNVALSGGYLYAGDFREGFAVVFKDGKWGFVDKKGMPLSGFVYDAARGFSEGKAAVMTGNRWGFIGRSGQEMIEPRYEEVGRFSEGFAKVRLGGLWGFVDGSGAVKIEPKFEDAKDFSEGLAPVRQPGGLWGYIGAGGGYRIPPRFEAAYDSENRMMLVKKPAAVDYGYVDQDGEDVVFTPE
ncbi:WG repeat-containing protein [Saccharibacillus alkalitolerans]|uniref:WG repeat-containing protein n=1 Tax=Saccharibacillus alkalitolerans TaxID=2705290 RepID=A0ABX0FAR3_9BACL|nr:WG repeat-containing protein [Saccharibacillus alkalitolerans]NGZ78038.1 WG repeat-containing protein [Saccharibacillus alkalitolerans]